MATFELYRRSTIGMCLTETLDEMVQSGTLSPDLAIQVLTQFDKSMTEALETQVKSKVTIKIFDTLNVGVAKAEWTDAAVAIFLALVFPVLVCIILYDTLLSGKILTGYIVVCFGISPCYIFYACGLHNKIIMGGVAFSLFFYVFSVFRGFFYKGHLHTYRFCDNVWTFILQDALFKNEENQENVGRVKIVACDSKLLTQ